MRFQKADPAIIALLRGRIKVSVNGSCCSNYLLAQIFLQIILDYDVFVCQKLHYFPIHGVYPFYRENDIRL